MQAIHVAFPNIPRQPSWDRLIKIAEHCQQQLKLSMVSWGQPSRGIYKLNTDHSAIHISGQIGGGGIKRGHQCKLIYAFAIPFGFGTYNFTEMKAALYGLNWCVKHEYKNIILEVDSELLSK